MNGTPTGKSSWRARSRPSRTTPAAPAASSRAISLYLHGVEADVHPDSVTAAVQATRAEPGTIALISYDRPTDSEISELADELELHPLLVEDLVHAHQRPKLERHDDALFAVVKSALYIDEAEDVVFSEFHVVIDEHVVVVIRRGDEGDPAWTSRDFTQPPEVLAFGPEAFLYAVLDRVVDGYFPVLDGLTVDVEQIERQVFSGDNTAPQRIYRLSREVIDFQHAASPLIGIIEDLRRGFDKYRVEPGLQDYLQDVSDHLKRIVEHAIEIRDLLDRILNVNATLVGQRQNEDMKRISSWAAILFAPTLIAAIYGMNFKNMPELHWVWGYPLSIAGMLVLGLALYWIFKRRGWL